MSKNKKILEFFQVIIIKIKRICNKPKVRSFFSESNLSLNLEKKKTIICFIFSAIFLNFFASTAKAFDAPLQEMLSSSQGKEAAQIQDPSQDSNESNDKNQNKDEEKSVPVSITDPKEIEDAANFASQATGVRKDFLMGMLVVESNLGRNPGKCTYSEVQQGALLAHQNGRLSDKAWQTFQDRQDKIEDIAKNLGYDPEKLQVSCNPGSAYAGTGGAMGVPQFMPDIWMAYKDRIGAIVGKDNPDPWNVKDGTVAMALLVADTPGVTDHLAYAERNAAKMYLSGSTSSQYEWYANQIFYWAQNYSKLLV